MEEQDDKKVPKGWKSDQVHTDPIKLGLVLGGEASHGQTSFMAASGGHNDMKSPDGWTTDENIPDGWMVRADMRISILRARMKKESHHIIDYLELKKMNETIETIRELWKGEVMTTSPEDGKPRIIFPQAGSSKSDSNLLLTDWTGLVETDGG